jgi:hypothetical protein
MPSMKYRLTRIGNRIGIWMYRTLPVDSPAAVSASTSC